MRLSNGVYSLGGLLEIGKRGIEAQKLNMMITGNNVTNAEVEGYTRQRVENEAGAPLNYTNPQVDTGVMPGTVRRMRNSFVDEQLRDENPSLARWQQESDLLDQVQNLFAEPSDSGISTILDKFFNSWERLAQNPDSMSSRTVVRDAAVTLSNRLNGLSSDLTNIQNEIDVQVEDTAEQINYYIREISQTTAKIKHSKEGSSELSAIMDRRDLALDKLSQLIDIQYDEKDDGDIFVYSNGIILNEGSEYNQLVFEKGSDEDLGSLVWRNENTEVKIMNGKLKGLLNVRDEVIPDVIKDMNEFVGSFVAEINNVHNKYFDLYGGDSNNFFDPEGLEIGNIKVDDAILQDVGFISVSGNSGAAGNAEGALKIVELADQKLFNNNTMTIKDKYSAFVTEFGTYTSEADRLADMGENLVSFLKEKKSSVKDVDIDEELANMIKFQQAYGAAARVINKADEMFQTVLNMV